MKGEIPLTADLREGSEEQRSVQKALSPERILDRLAEVEKRIESRGRELEGDTTRDQFLDFANVSEAGFEELPKHRIRGLLCYNHSTGDLPIKVMPSTAHESAIGIFQDCIGRQIYSMGIREILIR